MKLSKIKFNQLLNDAEKIVFTENDSYINTYPEFIKYFDQINPGNINEHNLVVASHFVYGWMPTIIRLDLKEKKEALRLLNDVRGGHQLSEIELNSLKKVVNNSLVGVSKLLHFINPKDYAIWDSKIFKYLTDKKSTYGIGKPKLYLNYLEEIKKISKHKNYNKLHTIISGYFDYEIHPTRAIELTMFETERNKSKLEKKGFIIEIDPNKLESKKTSRHVKQIEDLNRGSKSE